MRVLIASSFVSPHVGGVERFVDWAREALAEREHAVRVLACAYEDSSADVVVPTRYLMSTDWPLPVGGARRIAREVGRADVVLANSHRHVLPALVIGEARRAHTPALLGVHTAYDGVSDSRAYAALGAVFDRLVVPVELRHAVPLVVARSSGAYVERKWGHAAVRVPFEARATAHGHDPAPAPPARIVWAGRLAPEKDPLLAVRACEHARARVDLRLDVFGDGPLLEPLRQAAAGLPWLRLRGGRGWHEVMAAQERAQLVLSSSAQDSMQLAILEPMARGVPAVATDVGDARAYFPEPLAHLCVPPGRADVLGAAIVAALSDANDEQWRRNGERLREQHSHAAAVDAFEQALQAAASGRLRQPQRP